MKRITSLDVQLNHIRIKTALKQHKRLRSELSMFDIRRVVEPRLKTKMFTPILNGHTCVATCLGHTLGRLDLFLRTLRLVRFFFCGLDATNHTNRD